MVLIFQPHQHFQQPPQGQGQQEGMSEEEYSSWGDHASSLLMVQEHQLLEHQLSSILLLEHQHLQQPPSASRLKPF
jgi:hypothetical protein